MFTYQPYVDYFNRFYRFGDNYKIIDYPNILKNRYIVSNNGIVRRLMDNKIMSLRDHRGYYSTQLMTPEGRSKEVRIHRLVGYMFKYDTYAPDLVINHIDGNKKNNHVSNLEWVSQKYNVREAFRMGLVNSLKGEDINTATLTQNDVHKICKLILDGKDNRTILNIIKNDNEKVNMHKINNIRNKSTWRSISKEYF